MRNTHIKVVKEMQIDKKYLVQINFFESRTLASCMPTAIASENDCLASKIILHYPNIRDGIYNKNKLNLSIIKKLNT